MGKDMRKQSTLSLITGHFKHKDFGVHPWTINFIKTDVNFDWRINNAKDIEFESIFETNAAQAREIELEEMFNGI
jgi:hypothetical protein